MGSGFHASQFVISSFVFVGSSANASLLANSSIKSVGPSSVRAVTTHLIKRIEVLLFYEIGVD